MLPFLLLCLASGASAGELFLAPSTPQVDTAPVCGGNYTLGPKPTFPQVVHDGPGLGQWQKTSLAAVGLQQSEVTKALNFINAHVKHRQCFLLVKDGKIAYEWYDATAPDPPGYPFGGNWGKDMENKPHRGYSMTKTVAGFLLLMAATEDGLDIDADITKTYGVRSPKPYGVSLRMMMSQNIGGDDRPGEAWRYDELGDMWMHLFPEIIFKATGHKPSYYYNRLHSGLGLSKSFTWPKVDTEMFEGAAGSCRDWARFGQLINNNGWWGGQQLIAAKYIVQMQQPVKYSPMNEYANPCYGLLIWVNPDKAKVPGCCWEASRFPPPDCNGRNFLNGGVNDITLNIGLYGQVAMTLRSKNVVVVGFGNDLRPIEPARIGYYPAMCKLLGLPCNNPPAVPETKCGEALECTGVAAQCFSGGGWHHTEAVPGKEKCIQCFQERLIIDMNKFPTTGQMINGSCPTKTPDEAFKFMNCFCGMTGVNANPWHPWPKSLPTPLNPRPILPAPKCATPFPPAPPPPMPPPCLLPPQCVAALQTLENNSCYPVVRNGGEACYQGIRVHQQNLPCPTLMAIGQPLLASNAFCWCGVPHHEAKLASNLLPPPLANGEEEELESDMSETTLAQGIEEGRDMGGKDDLQDTVDPADSRVLPSAQSIRSQLFDRAQDRRRKHVGPPPGPTPENPPGGNCGWDHSRPKSLDRACYNKHDGPKLKHAGAQQVGEYTKDCARNCLKDEASTDKPCSCNSMNKCIKSHIDISDNCAECFVISMRCLTYQCMEECACGDHDACLQCGNKKGYKNGDGSGFNTCSQWFRNCAGFYPKVSDLQSLLGNQSLSSYFV